MSSPAAKRRRLSDLKNEYEHEEMTFEKNLLRRTGQENPTKEEDGKEQDLFHPHFPALSSCRSIDEYSELSKIADGTFGVVYRAKEKRTDKTVALKLMKLENQQDGFPISCLREINTLLKADHKNIVKVIEIVVGSGFDKVYVVMEYLEHDMRTLLDSFDDLLPVEQVKTLMIQLLSGVEYLHENWILHRDLKTSNLLLSSGGVLKIADFSLAREYGNPINPYTPLVVTLWYRAPELLLGAKEYSTEVDMWSVGCIFAEFLTLSPIFHGNSELKQLHEIYKVLGRPTERIWPGYSKLPVVENFELRSLPSWNMLKSYFGELVCEEGLELLNSMLIYDPAKRVTAAEASEHEWFEKAPLPVSPDELPKWKTKEEELPNK